ncbi:serine/threonine-protein phosphatase 7 long form homolog [Gossypium arboreum]|uniref:serine/threonine-protein phosphatase 7 long form homolog n=1 Tax=Gossypium arboreum TaxID=29729 RepID=UPI0022F186CF|nr:serine/threonine-protein phosphatase 7 long form homolog [Gossypium arboreum]
MSYLELARLRSAALTRTFDLRYNLISALVERWRPETHTFHLPCRECTVTLEDVALHFGLPIDGNVVTGVSTIAEPAALCYSLLGASPGDDESNFLELKFTWLKASFEHLSVNVTEEELMCAARAYIMHIIGGVLMPNANYNKVHLQYLPLLADLHNVRTYSWGSAVLAMLYRELCRTTKPDTFIWISYRKPEIATVIPSSAYVHSQLWCTNAPIISFNVVEWYHGDRVLRQFGCIQHIPDPPMQVGKVHGINKRGKHGMHWEVVY